MSFSKEEKKSFAFKKYLKEHLFDFALDIIGPMILTILVLYVCEAEEILYGIIISLCYSLGKIINRIRYYRKEYIDVDIK